MRFATPLACKEDKIACEVVKEGRTVDLSSISSFSQFLVCLSKRYSLLAFILSPVYWIPILGIFVFKLHYVRIILCVFDYVFAHITHQLYRLPRKWRWMGMFICLFVTPFHKMKLSTLVLPNPQLASCL